MRARTASMCSGELGTARLYEERVRRARLSPAGGEVHVERFAHTASADRPPNSPVRSHVHDGSSQWHYGDFMKSP